MTTDRLSTIGSRETTRSMSFKKSHFGVVLLLVIPALLAFWPQPALAIVCEPLPSEPLFLDSGQLLGELDSRAVVLGDVEGDGDLDARGLVNGSVLTVYA